MSFYRPSLRTRIYISMLAIILLSLLIIGATTIIFFDNQNEEYHQDRLKRKEHTVATSLQYFLKEVEIAKNMDFVRKDFEYKVKELADVNNIEINIFNTKGQVLMSSRDDKSDPEFYTRTIAPELLEKLQSSKQRQVESLNKHYVSTYSYVLNNEGQEIAIINIPYNLENSNDKSDLAPFLTTLLEIYAFLLIGASLLAYLLSNYITKSLREIANKLKEVKINKKNLLIHWKGEDEIGALVDEYNSMIEELESSTEKLAKSERESAWREMARQVAHEIKNPLTPMRLSVQHLERALDKNDPAFKKKLSKFSAKMVQQIDTLTSIANEFSNFAQMPKATISEIDIKEVLRTTCELFSETVEVDVVFETNDPNQVIILGDKEQLNRVFSNLIKNAIQAIPDDRRGVIKVGLVPKGNAYLIFVKDNGTGITTEIEKKIFSPNFTTKSTGAGLGLAMVKQIVDNHTGQIYFETQIGEGTTFYVELPNK